MSRATAMERIEKLRLQLEEAEAKAKQAEAKKAEAEKVRVETKKARLQAKRARLQAQAKLIAETLAEVESEFDALDNPSVQLEVVEDVTDDAV